MRKLLNKPWVVALLAISAVVLCTLSLRDQLGGGSSQPASQAAEEVALPLPATEPTEEAASTPSATPGDRLSIAAMLAALVFPERVPDPFVRRDATIVASEPEAEPPPVLPDEKETIRLTGVWEQGRVRLAVINNRILQIGDRLGRLTLDEIGVDGVWVSHWRGRDYVSFGGEFTLLTPAGGPAQAALARHEN